jgi:5'-3' exonuclease
MHLRCNASVKWYLDDFAHEYNIDRNNLLEYDFVGDSEFIHALEHQFERSLIGFLDSYRCKPYRTVLAKDCRRSEIWRKMLYSNYKSSRDEEKKPNQPNIGAIFGYVYDFLLPKLIDRYGLKLVEMKHAEGDDVIAVLSEYIHETSKSPIVILANDMDLCQLIKDRIDIVDYRGNSINEKCNERYGSPKRMLVSKILQGDRADDIPNICKGMGPKTAMKCIEDRELLMEKLEKFPEASKQLKMNKRLIDFQYIPEKLRNGIIKKYKEKMNED